MFTGIVKARGKIAGRSQSGSGLRLTIEAPGELLSGAHEGDSMCVAGACLTMLEIETGRFAADVSAETLDRTTLGAYATGRRVNLEPALRASDRLGGHLVSGHVDGKARLARRVADGHDECFTFMVPSGLSCYVARKGSVCLDGVSLTVNRVNGVEFDVNLIPHTLEVTTLGILQPGEQANIEVDMIARYLERLIAERG